LNNNDVSSLSEIRYADDMNSYRSNLYNVKNLPLRAGDCGSLLFMRIWCYSYCWFVCCWR